MQFVAIYETKQLIKGSFKNIVNVLRGADLGFCDNSAQGSGSQPGCRRALVCRRQQGPDSNQKRLRNTGIRLMAKKGKREGIQKCQNMHG